METEKSTIGVKMVNGICKQKFKQDLSWLVVLAAFTSIFAVIAVFLYWHL